MLTSIDIDLMFYRSSCRFELSHHKYADSGFGGLEVACWPLVPMFAGSNRAEAVGFLRAKNPQHAFLRMGSKAVCPMS
jgi:hypothetical protein